MLIGRTPALAQQEAPPGHDTASPSRSIRLTPAQLFAFADRARDASDYANAADAYRALATNPDIEIRTEARFRLAMMLADRLGRYAEAAVLLRQILDEKPNAARVRLELARMQAKLGNFGAARRELRAAEASGLPSSVEQVVRFYARALTAEKSSGGSIAIALAPDSNINRATRSDTLGTVIGNFTLDDNARAKSGIGLDVRGQTYARFRLQNGTDLLVQASTSARLYHSSQFDDIDAALQAGPQFASGSDRVSLSVGPSWRWFGSDLYSSAITASTVFEHPTGKRGQIRLDGSVSRVINDRNLLETANRFTVGAGVDRALSDRLGVGAQIFGSREGARDPGYSLIIGGISAYAYYEVNKTTFVGKVGYSHLEADARLFLYPRRRIEQLYSASITATLRALRVNTFAPTASVGWEHNASTVGIYDYDRVFAEFGITTAF